MKRDSNEVEILDPEECLKTLGSVSLGRVVFTDRALPAIQPVTFILDGGDIVISTAPDSLLGVALRGSIVAFEADQFDEATGDGWTVTVIGLARTVVDPADLDHLAAISPPRLRPLPGDCYVRISCTHIDGRLIDPPSTPAAPNAGIPVPLST